MNARLNIFNFIETMKSVPTLNCIKLWNKNLIKVTTKQEKTPTFTIIRERFYEDGKLSRCDYLGVASFKFLLRLRFEFFNAFLFVKIIIM